MKYREHVSSEDFKRKVMSLIPAGKSNAITTNDLTSHLGCSRRMLKKAILELRAEKPICSKDTGGGGYWIADCDEDIVSFNNVLSARRDTTDATIQKMTEHIGGPY